MQSKVVGRSTLECMSQDSSGCTLFANNNGQPIQERDTEQWHCSLSRLAWTARQLYSDLTATSLLSTPRQPPLSAKMTLSYDEAGELLGYAILNNLTTFVIMVVLLTLMAEMVLDAEAGRRRTVSYIFIIVAAYLTVRVLLLYSV